MDLRGSERSQIRKLAIHLGRDARRFVPQSKIHGEIPDRAIVVLDVHAEYVLAQRARRQGAVLQLDRRWPVDEKVRKRVEPEHPVRIRGRQEI
jgi:hypothetical protein